MNRRDVISGLALTMMPGIVRAQGDATNTLIASDRIRFPLRSLQLSNTLTEYVGGRARSSVVLSVMARVNNAGRFNTLVRYVKPARDTGKIVLFKESDLWFYDPSSKATIRISPQQRLLGQASNGDVVLSNFATDYTITSTSSERIGDADKVARNCLRLALSAKTPAAAYRKVELWLEVGTSRPVRARFYASSGEILKTAYWRAFKPVLGEMRPTETVIIDSVNANLVTTMITSDFQLRDIPEAWFNRNALANVTR